MRISLDVSTHDRKIIILSTLTCRKQIKEEDCVHNIYEKKKRSHMTRQLSNVYKSIGPRCRTPTVMRLSIDEATKSTYNNVLNKTRGSIVGLYEFV